jgi:hypothetical protein
MKELNINVEAKGNELIIREGKALELAHPSPIELKGTLEAPMQFLTGKLPKKDFDPTDCHLLIHKDKGEIKLTIHDRSPQSKIQITGSLTADTILQQFKLNSDHRWTVQEFLKFIKTMRFYFADRAAHGKLVQSMQKWQVKVERVITEHNDNRGNSNFQLETKVQQSITGDDGLIVKLNVPLFQGYAKHKFSVEIGLDPKATSVQLYLISDDLIELEIGQREKLIQDELKKFETFACSKVVIS